MPNPWVSLSCDQLIPVIKTVNKKVQLGKALEEGKKYNGSYVDRKCNWGKRWRRGKSTTGPTLTESGSAFYSRLTFFKTVEKTVARLFFLTKKKSILSVSLPAKRSIHRQRERAELN
jgi:hypothetical protein